MIRNYTSEVPTDRSLARIEAFLVRAGATHTARMYENGKVMGMFFQLPINGLPMTFKLPARVEACLKVLIKERKSLNLPARTEFGRRKQEAAKEKLREQAERTAFRILEDWVSVNVSLVELGQAEAIEVFLPHVYNQETNKTLFETAKEGGFKLLTAGKGK